MEFCWAIIWSGSSISRSFRNSKCQSARQYRRRWKWHDQGHSSALVSLSGEAHSRSLNPLLFRTRFAYLVISFTVLVLKITNNSTVGHTEHFGNKFYSAGSEGFEGFNFDNNKLQRILSPLEQFGNKIYLAGSKGFEGLNFDNNKLQRMLSPLVVHCLRQFNVYFSLKQLDEWRVCIIRFMVSYTYDPRVHEPCLEEALDFKRHCTTTLTPTLRNPSRRITHSNSGFS